MTKLPRHGTFVPVFHAYLDLGLSYHQAALVAYIQKWNRVGNECFASVEEIAHELRLTYITMRRVIARSITDNIITGSTGDKGRARTLALTPSFLDQIEKLCAQSEQGTPPPSAQYEQGECSKGADQVLKVSRVCAQSEQLPRSNLDLIPKLNTNIKIQRLNQVEQPTAEKANKAAEKFGLKKRFDY